MIIYGLVLVVVVVPVTLLEVLFVIIGLLVLFGQICFFFLNTSQNRGKTTKIQTLTKKIDEDLDEIKDLVSNYQHKLKAADEEIANERIETVPMIQELERSRVNIC